MGDLPKHRLLKRRGGGRKRSGKAPANGVVGRGWRVGRFGPVGRIQTTVACLVLLGAALGFLVTRTPPGRGILSAWAERIITARIQGDMKIGRILDGDLFGRTVFEYIELHDPEGEFVMRLDTVSIQYSPSFFSIFWGGGTEIQDMHARQAVIHLVQSQDFEWNIDRATYPVGWVSAANGFPLPQDAPQDSSLQESDPDAGQDVARRPPEAEGRPPLLIENMVADRFSIRILSIPPPEVLAGRSPWARTEGPDGLQRALFAVDDGRAHFSHIRLAPDSPILLEVGEVSGVLTLLTQPLHAESLRGSVTIGDSIRYQIDGFKTPGSALSGSGWTDWDWPPSFDFEFEIDSADVSDLGWTGLPLPQSGSTPARLRTWSDPAGFSRVRIEEVDLRSGGMRIQGDVSFVSDADPPVVEMASFELDRVPASVADDILGTGPGKQGLISGELALSGRADQLEVDADLMLEPTEVAAENSAPGPGPGAASFLAAAGQVRFSDPDVSASAAGGVDARPPGPALEIGDVTLHLEEFDPAWLVDRGLPSGAADLLSGRHTGSWRVTRTPDNGYLLEGRAAHLNPAGQTSDLTANLAIEPVAGFVDGSLLAAPWFVTGGQGLWGSVEVSGTLDQLALQADLSDGVGRVLAAGVIAPGEEPPSYDVELSLDNISLDVWIEDWPATDLNGSLLARGRGLDPATMELEVELEIGRSRLGSTEIEDAYSRGTVSAGQATVEFLTVDSDLLAGQATGTVGLAEQAGGTLRFDFDLPEVADFAPWLENANLPLAIRPGPGEQPSFTGAVSVGGELTGGMQAADLVLSLAGRDVGWNAYEAAVVTGDVRVPALPSFDGAHGQASLLGVSRGEWELDSLAVDARFSLEAAAPGGPMVPTIAYQLAGARDTTLAAASSGTIEVGENGRTEARIDQLWIELGSGELVLDAPVRLVHAADTLAVGGFDLTGTLGSIRASGQIPGSLEVNVADLDVGQAAYALTPWPETEGVLSVAATAGGTVDSPLVDFAATIQNLSLRGQRVGDWTATVGYADRGARVRADLFSAFGATHPLFVVDGTVKTDLALAPVDRRLLPDPFALRVYGDSLALALATLAVLPNSDVSGISGYGSVDMFLEGGPGDLRVNGGFSADGGAAELSALGVGLLDLTVRANLLGTSIQIDSLSARSSEGGVLDISGSVDIAEVSDPVFDLGIVASDFGALRRPEATFSVSGDLRLEGPVTAPRITGDATVSDGEIRPDAVIPAGPGVGFGAPYGAYGLGGITDGGLLTDLSAVVAATPRPSFEDVVRVAANIAAGPDLWLRSPQLDVELESEGLSVEMDRSSGLVSVTGSVNIPRGTYRFDRLPPYVQSLQVTAGALEFRGGTLAAPDVSVEAEYRTRTRQGEVLVTAQLDGTLGNYSLSLSSTPPMSVADQHCFLAVGTPCFESVDQQLGSRLLRETFLSSLSSGISSALVGPAGLSFLNVTSIAGDNDPSAPLASRSWIDRTVVEFGWYPRSQLFVSLWQPLGGGPPRASIDWDFLPGWTIEGRAGSRFDERLFGLNRAAGLTHAQTFGVFLFRDWETGQVTPPEP